MFYRCCKRSLCLERQSMLLSKYQFSYGLGFPSPPELRDIVKLELFEQESIRRIEEIWLDEYRFSNRYISRVLSKDCYQTLINRLEECPLFIWPIKYEKSGKYYVLLSQYQYKHLFFTSIDSYHKSAENATSFMVFTIYDDLMFSSVTKDVALVRCEVVDPIHLSIEQGRDLCDSVLNAYQNDIQFEENILMFNNNSAQFDIEQYLNTFDFVRKANEKETDLK